MFVFLGSTDVYGLKRLWVIKPLLSRETKAFTLLEVVIALAIIGISWHCWCCGVTSVIQGGKFQSGFLSAGFSQFAGPHINELGLGGVDTRVARTVAGGIGSMLGGGKFENGAMTATFAYAYNDLYQERTGKVGGLHERDAVRDKDGNMLYGMSFRYNGSSVDDSSVNKDSALIDNIFSGAFDGDPQRGKAGNGVVYEDDKDPAIGVVPEYRTNVPRVFSTSPEEDRAIIGYMKSRGGDTAPYNAVTNSSIGFSGREFDKIRDAINKSRAEGGTPEFK